MAITATNWSRRANITGATPAATLTGFVALITGANLPAEIWSTAKNGGGDLRACLDKNGANELPIEVVTFDTVAQEAIIFVRFPTYEAAATGLWIFYGNSSAITYDVAATYGRNAVWADYYLVLHGINGPEDSTGNGTATINGTPSYSENGVRLPAGAWLQYDHGGMGNGSVSMSAHATVHTNDNKILGDTARYGGVVFTTRDSEGDYSPTLLLSDHTSQRTSFFADRVNLAAGVTTEFHTLGQQHLLHGRFERSGSGKAGGTWTLSFDGTLYTNSNLNLGAGALVTYAFAGNPVIGYHPVWGHDPDIEIKFLQVTLLEHSDDYITTQHDNQNSPETFWTLQTVEGTGGAATEEYSGALPAASVYASASIDAYKNTYALFVAYAVAQATGQAQKGSSGEIAASGTGTGAAEGQKEGQAPTQAQATASGTTDGHKSTGASQNAQAYASGSTDGYKAAPGALAAIAAATASTYGSKTGYGTLQAQATALASLQAGEGETIARVGTITVQAIAGQPAQNVQGYKGSYSGTQANATGTATASGTKATGGNLQITADALYVLTGQKGTAGSLGQAALTGDVDITGHKASAGAIAPNATVNIAVNGNKVISQVIQVTAAGTISAQGQKAAGDQLQATATATVRFIGYTDSVTPRYQTLSMQGVIVRHVFTGVRQRYSVTGVISNV